MTVNEFGEELWKRLSIEDFPFDISLNGFQIQGPDRELRKAAFAVDASFATIDAAAEASADILVVHHGLFWGSPIAIRGAHYRRVKRALDSGLSLFACHLPLDAHPLYGNNAQIALTLGMTSFDPFGEYKGRKIGFKGRLPFPMTVPEVARLLVTLFTFLACAIGVRDHMHISVTMLYSHFPKGGKMRRFMDVLSDVATLLCGIFLVYYGTMYVVRLFGRPGNLPMTGLPTWVQYIPAPLGGIVVTFDSILFLAGILKPEDLLYSEPEIDYQELVKQQAAEAEGAEK